MMSSGSYAPVSKEEDDAYAAHLQQNLVGPDPSQALPTVTSVPMMQVVAPATLPEGYEFQAVAGNRTFTVTVPPGGIEQGQKFEVPFPHHLESAISGISVPVGHWRDGLFEIFRYGACHPHCWTGCFCHLLAAGQVIARLKLTALGRPGNTAQAARAFQIIFGAVTLYFSIYVAMGFVLVYLDPNTYEPPGSPQIDPPTSWLIIALIRDMFHYIYWIATAIVLTNLRRFVRQKYAIPDGPVGDWEDCCCSCWCPCFVSAQMLRHTTDYDVYPATCCTERGIPPNAPSIL